MPGPCKQWNPWKVVQYYDHRYEPWSKMGSLALNMLPPAVQGMPRNVSSNKYTFKGLDQKFASYACPKARFIIVSIFEACREYNKRRKLLSETRIALSSITEYNASWTTEEKHCIGSQPADLQSRAGRIVIRRWRFTVGWRFNLPGWLPV